MSLPDRNNPYSFEPFLESLHSFDFYRDDPFLRKVLAHFAGDEMPDPDEKLSDFSKNVSGRWRELADSVAQPELRPRLENYNAHNRRVDRLIRPAEAHTLEREIFGEGLFSQKTGPWEGLTKRFLLHQLGEFCVMCPIACTEGLIALMEQFPNPEIPELAQIVNHCKEGEDGNFGIGAQFMSEIQGGSDLPANLLEAVPDGKHYRVFGNKFFCSAIHADYSVLTAKVSGSDKLGTFVVPSWLPGDKAKEIRNGYRINRIKWKMGTSELPTAEVDYDGALAYPVGPTDRGVANAVGIVLTLSRLTVGVCSAGVMVRAAREAMLYSEFRDVFGAKMCQFPLAAYQINQMVDAAQRAAAGVYKIYDLFVRLGRKLQPGLKSDEPEEMQKKRFVLRELIILQKLCLAYEAVDVIRKAMSMFGGHGVIEDFSSLPRLLRDSAVNELWEGPKNVLLMQLYRDIMRVAEWYPPKEFIADTLEGAPQAEIERFGAGLQDFIANPPALEVTAESMKRSAEWETFMEELFKTYQNQAVNEIGREPVVNPERIRFPNVWNG